MKLHNVIIVFDVYALAETPEAARAVILAGIRGEDPLNPNESVALPVSRERELRPTWHAEKPFVAEDVSDEDFAKIKGKTTLEIFKLLNGREEPAEVPAPKPRKGGAA